MNYYKHHLGDYAAATRHLSLLEHGVYRCLIDIYYISEAPLPKDLRAVCRLVCARSKDEREAVELILEEFFLLTDDGWRNSRCDLEIEAAQAKAEKNRELGKRGGRPKKTETETVSEKNPDGFQNETETVSEKNPSHKPIANSQYSHISVANATSGNSASQSPPDGDAPEAEKNEPLTLFPVAHPMACPVEKLVGLYHELMPRNPRCKVLNQTRRKAIQARWKEAAYLDTFPFKGGYDSQAKGLACWREFFAVCADSDFLTGRSQPTPGRPVFLADLDFLMSPSAFAKTLENKYHREVA